MTFAYFPRISAKSKIAVLATVLVALSFGIGFRPSIASAHARLKTSEPSSGTALATMPGQFVLSFSEPVDITYSSFSLLTSDGEETALGTPQLSGDDLIVTIAVTSPETDPSGIYTLVFRVLSAADGHASNGAVAFSVGTGVAPPVGSTDGAANPDAWRVIANWGLIVSLALIVGVFGFAVLIARDATLVASALKLFEVRLAFGVLCASLLAIAYDLGLIAADSGPLHPPGLSVYREVELHSRSGHSVVAVAVITALICGLLIVARRGASPWVMDIAGLALSLAALFAVSYASHAAADSSTWREIAIDWAHLAAVSLWFGMLVRLWRETSEAVDEKSVAIVSRFSRAGLVLMAVLIGSGVLRASVEVDGQRLLTHSDYGRILIVKHVLLAAILVVAAVNQLVLVPKLKASVRNGYSPLAGIGMRQLRRFVSIELAIAVGAIAAAAVLTQLPPANGQLTVDVAAKPLTINQRAMAGDVSVWMLAKLDGADNDRFTITLEGADGRAPENLQKVIVATSNGQTSDRFDAEQLVGSPGTYVFPALRLGLRTNWKIEVIVRRAGVEDVATTFTVDTTAAGPNPPRLVEDQWRWPRFIWSSDLFVAAAFVVLAGGLVLVKKLPGLEPFAVGIMLMMVVLIAAGFLVQGYRQAIAETPGTNLENPVLADDASIARGADSYSTMCLQCHGPDGAGLLSDDDPDHAHGASADLIDDPTAKQRDGDLFWTIGAGVPGTLMPAFDASLTEAERWDLVNYLRVLQRARPTAVPGE